MQESSNNSQAPLLRSESGPSTSRDDYGARLNSISGSTSTDDNSEYPEDDENDEDAVEGEGEDSSARNQGGVRQADAINQVWSKAALVTAYIFIFLASLGNALQWQIIFNLMPYVVSEFESHSLIPTIAIVSSILSGVLKLPVAKIVDLWGRPQGFASTALLAATGMLLMAVSPGVRTYAAANVIYSIGISGCTYVHEIIVADTSSLRNRSLAFGFSSFPYLISTLVGPGLASRFTENGLWRWAFAASAVFLLTLYFPLFYILMVNMRKAKKLGLLHSTKAEPWTRRKIHQYLVDFDALGILLLSAGMTCILVPFSLTSGYSTNATVNAYTVTMLLGIGFTVAFVAHERKTAKPFIAVSLLCSRNVAGACLLSVTLFVAYFAWDGYYTSYLQVVHGLSITQAGLVGQIYSLGSSIWAIVVGYLIHKTDRFKWLAVLAVPVHILGGISMIVFRRPDTHIIWVVMCQIFLTVGGCTLVMCDQMAVMAVASHADLASILAILSLASYVGSALGSSLSGAIWNHTLPGALAELLPELGPGELAHIASNLKEQLSYPMGSPTRTAIVAAYAKSQARMCIVGSIVSLLEIAAVILWKDSKLSKSRQVQGTVL
ncbi:MFS general substrate transporter [Poronia punctata]|nr:MFS general substrate transporter [Poronia punctata]